MDVKVNYKVPESTRRKHYEWKENVEKCIYVLNENDRQFVKCTTDLIKQDSLLLEENHMLRKKISQINRKANKNTVLLLFFSLGTLIFMVADMRQHKDIDYSIDEIHKEVKRIKVKFIPK